jgi:hypothetical protein
MGSLPALASQPPSLHEPGPGRGANGGGNQLSIGVISDAGQHKGSGGELWVALALPEWQEQSPRVMDQPPPPPDPGYALFIAAPMSALQPNEYAGGRDDVLAVIDALAHEHGVSRVYFAGAAIHQVGEFTAEDEALRRDIAALRHSRLFVLLYPQKLVTSALVEVGFALGLGLPCLLLVNDRDDLPYLLHQAEEAGNRAGLPPLQIGRLGSAAETAARIAAFCAAQGGAAP